MPYKTQKSSASDGIRRTGTGNGKGTSSLVVGAGTTTIEDATHATDTWNSLHQLLHALKLLEVYFSLHNWVL